MTNSENTESQDQLTFAMFQQILAMFLVLGLLLGMLLLLRRTGHAKGGFLAGLLGTGRGLSTERRLRVLERIALTQQHSLHLVMIDNRLVVFAASPGGCQAVDPSALIAHADQNRSSARNGAAL